MRRRLLVWVTTLVTLGSGLVNLFSVAGPRIASRHSILLQFFPLEFLHLSRSITLLIGFALVISSINIYRRKRRAYYAVLALSGLSVIFHITKGLNYEEAAFSAVLVALLWGTRSTFTVRSGIPDWESGIVRLGLAYSFALVYGIAGFWFLDPREFGINFTLADSIHRTLHFLTLIGDPEVVPRTRHALWFVDSLYLTTLTTVVYSGFALFRPAIYQFRIHPHEQARARAIVGEYSRCSQDYFKTWPDKSLFFSASEKCFVAYRVAGNFAVALGDPVGPAAEMAGIIREFKTFCDQNDWGLAFHQALPNLLPVYRELGFKTLKIGDQAIVDLASFSLDGKGMKPARNAITKLDRSGVQIARYEPPVPDDVIEQLYEVSEEWLQIPGRRERQFTLGRFDPDYLRSTPVTVAREQGGRIVAFVNEIGALRKEEVALDLMRRRTEAPNGIMDYLFVKVLLASKERGFKRFDLGMAPMAGFQEKEEASQQERAVHAFFQQLNFLFSYKGLRAYKAKFASVWEPRYAVYRNALDLPRLAIALGKVSAIRE